MSPSTYYKSMGAVLQSVLSRIARDILFLDDMAAEETLQVIFVFLSFISSASNVFFTELHLTHEHNSAPKADSLDAGGSFSFAGILKCC